MSYVSLVFTCANCDGPGVANPSLVLSIPSRWDAQQRRFVADPNGKREPVCRACAILALERIRSNDPTLTSVSSALREPDYMDRAYGFPAEEELA